MGCRYFLQSAVEKRGITRTGVFLIHRKLRPMNEKVLRAGLHCVGVELCR